MTLTQLKYIIAVADAGTFAAAAQICNVTQPTMSMQIQKLEETLGVTIFDRSKSPVRVTEIGEKIIFQARNIVRESAKIPDLISNEANKVAGQFKLGVIPTVAPLLLPKFLGSFLSEYPELSITIDELHTKTIIDYLNRDKLDAGILALPINEDNLKEIPVYREDFVGLVSKNHRLSNKKTISPEDLSRSDLLLLKEGHCFRDQVLDVCSTQEGNNDEEHKIVFEAGSLETLTNLVESGYGMTLIPAMAKKQFSNGRAEYIKEFEGKVPNRTIGIIHQKGYLKRNIIDALQNSIIKSLERSGEKVEVII
jgi:LysR family hydrogen peroxide-inducible transcriptional activator